MDVKFKKKNVSIKYFILEIQIITKISDRTETLQSQNAVSWWLICKHNCGDVTHQDRWLLKLLLSESESVCVHIHDYWNYYYNIF